MAKKNLVRQSSFFLDEPAADGPLPPMTLASAPVSAPIQPPPAVNEPQTMNQLALVFLDEPIARRLAVAWITCGGVESEWFVTAGFPSHSSDAVRISKMLRANGICRAGGTTDPLALQYINALIAKPLASAANRAKKGDAK